MSPTNKYGLILLTLLLGFFTACSSNRHLRDLEKYVDDMDKTMLATPTKVAPLPINSPTPVIYQSNSERSPFETTNESIGKPTVISVMHPIQNYPISVLQFKGTVVQDNNILAFILTPDGKLYQVKIGDIIGNHYGKIVKIYPDRIEVEEKTTDNGKKASTRTVTLQLKDES